MGKPESKIESYLVKRVKQEGGTIHKVRYLGRNGCPDRLIWWTFPNIAFIECKASPSAPLKPSQQREIPRLLKAGWPVFVVATEAEVEDVIARVKGC